MSDSAPPAAVVTGTKCDRCAGKCCRYYALEIDEPEDREDFEYLRWYMCHERTVVYTHEGMWYLHVENRCRHLDEHNRCAIYDRRPDICREHDTEDCEFDETWEYGLKFTTLEELEYYIDAALGRRKYRPEE